MKNEVDPNDWLIYKQIGQLNLTKVKGVSLLTATYEGFEFVYTQDSIKNHAILHYTNCYGRIFKEKLKPGKELDCLFRQLDFIFLKK